MVPRPGPGSEERCLELHPGIDRFHRDQGRRHGGPASEASRPGADGRACHLQLLGHVQEALRGGARCDGCRQGQGLRRASHRLRPLHAGQLAARDPDGDQAQSLLLADGRGRKAAPYLDEVDFQIISDDATRILKLQAGEVDGAEFIPYARVAELKGDPNLNMELFPSTKATYLTLNIRPALNFAIDKDAVIKLVTFGVGTPMRSYMSSSTPLFYGPGPAYAYDLAKAKALMKDAGQENGFALDAQALAGSADDVANLSTIRQMWAQLGVKLNITQMDN